MKMKILVFLVVGLFVLTSYSAVGIKLSKEIKSNEKNNLDDPPILEIFKVSYNYYNPGLQAYSFKITLAASAGDPGGFEAVLFYVYCDGDDHNYAPVGVCCTIGIYERNRLLYADPGDYQFEAWCKSTETDLCSNHLTATLHVPKVKQVAETPTLDNKGRVYGYVKDPHSDEKISDATVTLGFDNYITTTNSEGYYEIKNIRLPFSGFIYASKDGYRPRSTQTTVRLTKLFPEREYNLTLIKKKSKSKSLNTPLYELFNNPLLSRLLERFSLFS